MPSSRLLYIGVPGEQAERVSNTLNQCEFVMVVTRLKSGDHIEPQALFTCKTFAKHTATVLDLLRRLGVGEEFGFVDILALQSSIPLMKTKRQSKRQYRVDDRVCFEEIYQSIDREIHLTFDYLALCCIATMICCIGVISNNSPIVVASLLISPLTYPFMGVCFGTLIRDRSILTISLRNFFIGVAIILALSIVIGLIVYPFISPTGLLWPNSEMNARGDWPGLVASVLMAIPSGAGVTIAIVGALNATILGVAVAALLVPSLSNLGLQISVGLLTLMVEPDKSNQAKEYLASGGFSALIFISSLSVVYFVSLLFFYIKKVLPMASNSDVSDISFERNTTLHHSVNTPILSNEVVDLDEINEKSALLGS